MKRSEAIVLAAGALALGARPAYAQTSGARAAIRIGALPIESMGEAYYGDDLGFFQRAGLDARVEAMSNSGTLVSAVIAGTIDVGPTNCVTMAQAYSKGLPIYFIAPGAVYSAQSPTTELAVANDSTYRTARDLNGKRIAVLTLGGFLQVATQNWLDLNGADSKSVTFLELPSSEIVAALQAKRVAAAGLPEPFRSSAKAQNAVRFIAAPYSSVGKRVMVSAWVANRAWVDANPATVRSFIAAIRATAQWANTHSSAAATVLSKYTHLPVAVIESMNRDPFAALTDVSTIQPIIDVCAKYALIPRRFPAADLFAPNIS
ncbi:MAG TPA: ABC transporter substrate-binding protein [Candidatus Lustribacter sp.]